MDEAGPGTDRTDRKSVGRFEIAAAIILSLTALITSWASFQAELWDGEEAAAFTRAGAARVEAGRAKVRAGQVEGIDMQSFSLWLDAYARSDNALARFYRERFRPEFAATFEQWIARHPQPNPGAPQLPFAMPGYRARDLADAAALEQRADTLFESGRHANRTKAAFVNGTVILALALFVGGIAQSFHARRVQVILLTVAALACLAGLLRIAELPTLQPG
jgi:hypothetical protein